MQALALTHNFPRFAGDPVGSFILRLAVALRERGIETHAVAPAAHGAPLEEAIEGIRVTRYRYAAEKLETIAYTGDMASQVRESWGARIAMAGLLASSYRSAKRIIDRESIDVIHAHWWFPGGLIARALHDRTGLPYIVTMHGSDIRLAGSLPGGRALFKFVAAKARTMTTVSSWLAGEATHLDSQTHPIVAPMPVVAELFHPGGNRRVSNRLLFVGKLTEQKGLPYLLRALPLMRHRADVDVVGAGRVDDAAVRRLAEELGVADRIKWHPLLSQPELAVLYRTAAIHVIPAINEGLGLTAVESLLSETPVVAFDSGGIPDVVRHDNTGLLVPRGDVAALAAALDRLLGDEPYRIRLGVQGRIFALSHFGPEVVATRYAGLLRS